MSATPTSPSSASVTPQPGLPQALTNRRIHFIGGGNMASSILGGLIKGGISPSHLSVTEPNPERARILREAWGIAVDDYAQPADSDIVVLAIKPQIFPNALPPLAAVLKPDALVISIAAGIPLAHIRQHLGPTVKLVRAMPNTPALVNHGITGLFGDQLSETEHALADGVLASVGKTLWVESEALIDAVTTVSGSGPAYFFLLMEAMIEGGTALGLSEEDSRALTLHTALGAARLALPSGTQTSEPASAPTAKNVDSPAVLRQKVTSPGGTTAAAINHMLDHQLPQIVIDALASAYRRAQELGASS